MYDWEFQLDAARSAYQQAENVRGTDQAAGLYRMAARGFKNAARLCRDEAKKQEILELAKKAEELAESSYEKTGASGPAQGKAEKANEKKPAFVVHEPNSESLEASLAKLNDLTGLEEVKRIVNGWVLRNRVFKKRDELNLKTMLGMTYHMAFLGNPGTGKTTVARIIGEIYKELGLLESGHVVETQRYDLVAEYVGQTAVKTKAVIDRAMGGVLFIDEAYSLSKQDGGRDFGQEAIDTLVAEMENQRKNLVVIVAGYTDSMKAFFDSNRGLASRFKTLIEFNDYKPDELLTIFKNMISPQDYELSPKAEKKLKDHFAKLYNKRDSSFGNARMVRNLMEDTINRQAIRLASKDYYSLTREDLITIEPEDIPVDDEKK